MMRGPREEPVPRRESGLEDFVGPEQPDEQFRRYYHVVVGFFLRRGFSPEESRDLAQETFLRVFRQRDSFRGETSVETWLFQLASNLYKNTIRSRQTLKRDAKEVSFDEAADVGLAGALSSNSLGDLLAGERDCLLREAIRDLPDQMRRCVTLRVDQDLKYREIALLMGVSIEIVKAHLYQARQILRDKLADFFTEGESHERTATLVRLSVDDVRARLVQLAAEIGCSIDDFRSPELVEACNRALKGPRH
jgi:RNA polymerase sigma-70 factor (ECF subfamily)